MVVKENVNSVEEFNFLYDYVGLDVMMMKLVKQH